MNIVFVLNYNNEVNLTLNCLYRLFNFFCTKYSVCGYDWAGLTDLGAWKQFSKCWSLTTIKFVMLDDLGRQTWKTLGCSKN